MPPTRNFLKKSRFEQVRFRAGRSFSKRRFQGRVAIRLNCDGERAYHVVMAISRELWISNLVGIAKDLGDSKHQRTRWLAPDAAAWERPAELLNVALDDYQLELFVIEHGSSLSPKQRSIALAFLQQSKQYDVGTGWRDPKEVLSDPVWERLRQTARAFVAAFEEVW